tara:strand:- start:30960 stop:31604 length:645 start_codon:yes stop_codon:yes gene_type:complete
MFIPIVFIFTIWFIKGIEHYLSIDFIHLGIKPKNIKQFFGIFSFPFIHSDLNHLLNNSYPMIILGGIICEVYKEISNKIFLFSYLLSGLLFWIFGDSSTNVVGASCFIYALGSFILISGFIKGHPRLIMLSFLVIFLNFFNLWGIIEIKNDNISQTSHLIGVITGIIIAIIFRKKGPQKKIYNYELEEEMNENINYIYKKNNYLFNNPKIRFKP